MPQSQQIPLQQIRGSDDRNAPPRTAEQSRRAILESAILAFSTYGFGGARVDKIASNAKVNKAMLYHYFGSKEDLYLAALEEIYLDIRRAEAELDLDMDDPEAAITGLVAFTFQYYIDHPAFIRIINTENLYGAVHLKGATAMPTLNAPILEKVAAILNTGVEKSVFRSGIDPLDLYISISALGFTYVANRHTLEAVFGRNLLAPDQIKSRLATMTDMVLRYLMVSPA